MKFASAIFTTLAAASSVVAHATFQQLWVNGVDQSGTCVNKATSNNPVTDVNSAAIACNTYSAATAKCAIPAGATVDVEMHQQPGDRNCKNEAIGGNHDGPVIVYMSKVDNALTAKGNSANWFKVGELGLIRKDYWGTDSLNANCGRFSFTVPSCIPAGDYLIKAEVIALHVAGSSGGAQFYSSCFPVTVSGGGSTLPSSTVKFPGAYKASDPGILFNLYGSYTSYTIPGPAVWTCSAGGVNAPPTNPATPTDPATVDPPADTPVPGADLYQQCGGINFTGPTTCNSGVCKKQSDYYSQCVPA